MTAIVLEAYYLRTFTVEPFIVISRGKVMTALQSGSEGRVKSCDFVQRKENSMLILTLKTSPKSLWRE